MRSFTILINPKFAVHAAGCGDIKRQAKQTGDMGQPEKGETAEAAAKAWTEDAYGGEVEFDARDWHFHNCTKGVKK